MAKGVNKVILIGNLGRDPEVRYTPDGVAIANITIATSESWKDKQTGENQERTEWHRIVFYRRQAEIVGEYLRKGSKIFVEGRLQTRKWKDKEGQDRYTTEVIGDSMQMLDSKGAGGGNSGGNAGYQASSAPSSSEKSSGDMPQPESMDNFDDDIPF